jgi:hypothetical protein
VDALTVPPTEASVGCAHASVTPAKDARSTIKPPIGLNVTTFRWCIMALVYLKQTAQEGPFGTARETSSTADRGTSIQRDR